MWGDNTHIHASLSNSVARSFSEANTSFFSTAEKMWHQSLKGGKGSVVDEEEVEEVEEAHFGLIFSAFVRNLKSYPLEPGDHRSLEEWQKLRHIWTHGI